MSTRSKRTSSQMCVDNFNTNCKKLQRLDQYKAAFKTATIEINGNAADPSKVGKGGYGVRAVIKRINDKMLCSPSDCKLSKTAVNREVFEKGQFGKSPPKWGAKESIPSVLPYALAMQSAMMQVSGDGEASALNMKATAQALISRTPHDNKVNVDYVWRRARKDYPEILNPVRAKSNEDRRIDWLTFKNIHDWNARAKSVLVKMGMASNEPGKIRK